MSIEAYNMVCLIANKTIEFMKDRLNDLEINT